MNAWRFLHAADIHLDSALRGLDLYEGAPVEEIRGATRRAFDRLIALAIDERVDFVLIAGDLYDGDWKDYNTGLYFNKCMTRLKEAGIRVFLITGNHDAASQITRSLRLPDNVTQFSSREPQTEILDDLGVAIHAQGFARRAVTDDLSLAYPRAEPGFFNIGMLHTCLDGKPGHEPYAPCHVDGLRSKGYDYWALGHVHQREIVAKEPWIVFPGNIQGRHICETGAKGCTLVSVDEGRVVAVEPRELDVMRWAWCRLDASGCADVDEIHQRLAERLRRLLDEADGRPVAARLSIEGVSSAHAELHAARDHWEQEYRALASGLGGAGIWLEKVVFATRAMLSIDDALARDDVLGGLLGAVQALKLDEASLQSLADALLPLRKKLPAELLMGEDAFDPTDRNVLKDSLEDIKALLLTRLLSRETAV